jgi:hypothetical protein
MARKSGVCFWCVFKEVLVTILLPLALSMLLVRYPGLDPIPHINLGFSMETYAVAGMNSAIALAIFGHQVAAACGGLRPGGK